MLPIFVYGTLCSPQVVQVLLGRSFTSFLPARLYGHLRFPVHGCVYPGMIPIGSLPSQHLQQQQLSLPEKEHFVDGFLLEGLSPIDIQILDWFEGTEYERVTVTVKKRRHVKEDVKDREEDDKDDKGEIPAEVYLWDINNIDRLELDRPWDYIEFEQNQLKDYLETTVYPCRWETERLGMTTSTTTTTTKPL